MGVLPAVAVWGGQPQLPTKVAADCLHGLACSHPAELAELFTCHPTGVCSSNFAVLTLEPCEHHGRRPGGPRALRGDEDRATVGGGGQSLGQTWQRRSKARDMGCVQRLPWVAGPSERPRVAPRPSPARSGYFTRSRLTRAERPRLSPRQSDNENIRISGPTREQLNCHDFPAGKPSLLGRKTPDEEKRVFSASVAVLNRSS